MSSRAELFGRIPRSLGFEKEAAKPAIIDCVSARNQDTFAEEQLRFLVRQVFFPGWPRPARQVVFSPVESGMTAAALCRKVAEALREEMPGNVCLVGATADCPEFEPAFGRTTHDLESQVLAAESLRRSSRQISDRLWALPFAAFVNGDGNGLSAAWLRGRLGQLRLEFDYTVLCAAPVGTSSGAALLGHLCDGVVLVLQAGATRRTSAQQVKAVLTTANARLLGTVLMQRTFPIPEGIYRRV